MPPILFAPLIVPPIVKPVVKPGMKRIPNLLKFSKKNTSTAREKIKDYLESNKRLEFPSKSNKISFFSHNEFSFYCTAFAIQNNLVLHVARTLEYGTNTLKKFKLRCSNRISNPSPCTFEVLVALKRIKETNEMKWMVEEEKPHTGKCGIRLEMMRMEDEEDDEEELTDLEDLEGAEEEEVDQLVEDDQDNTPILDSGDTTQKKEKKKELIEVKKDLKGKGREIISEVIEVSDDDDILICIPSKRKKLLDLTLSTSPSSSPVHYEPFKSKKVATPTYGRKRSRFCDEMQEVEHKKEFSSELLQVKQEHITNKLTVIQIEDFLYSLSSNFTKYAPTLYSLGLNNQTSLISLMTLPEKELAILIDDIGRSEGIDETMKLVQRLSFRTAIVREQKRMKMERGLN